MKTIESTLLPDGVYDHTKVKHAHASKPVQFEYWGSLSGSWIPVSTEYVPTWSPHTRYRAHITDDQWDSMETIAGYFNLLQLVKDKFQSAHECITITRAEVEAISKRIL